MSHSGSFLVGSQLDPTLALLMPSPGRLVPGALPLPSRARFVSAASAGEEASSGAFRDLVQRRSAPPPRDAPGNTPGNVPRSIDAEAPSFQGVLPGVSPAALPVVLTDKNPNEGPGENPNESPGADPDTNIVALPPTPSIESQTSESRVSQEASGSAQGGAERAVFSPPVPLQHAPGAPPGPFPGTLPDKRPAASSNLAAHFRQALAHYRAAALQLG